MSLFLVTVMLSLLGLLMIFSASYVRANESFGNPTYFFQKQLQWFVVGFIGLLVMMNVDYRRLRPLAKPAYLLAGALLLMVLLGIFGHSAKGSTRWIGTGFFRLQPSEPAKLAVILYLAAVLTEKGRRLADLKQGYLPALAVVLLLAGLVLAQPDLGTAISIVLISFVMLTAAGADWRHLLATAACSLPAGLIAWLYVLKPYQKARLVSFLNPQADPQGSGYHIIQSLIALGSGGLLGTGLSLGKQKYLYLPEQHTDFIFAIIGEELGFIGTALILAMFAWFAWRGYRAALKAPDSFGSLLACGITSMVICQAIINIGVVTRMLPITGIPLPFVSYGGSSLTLMLVSTGVLLNISGSGGVRGIEGGDSRRRNRRPHISSPVRKR